MTDKLEITRDDFEHTLRSAGAELYLDTRWADFPDPDWRYMERGAKTLGRDWVERVNTDERSEYI